MSAISLVSRALGDVIAGELEIQIRAGTLTVEALELILELQDEITLERMLQIDLQLVPSPLYDAGVPSLRLVYSLMEELERARDERADYDRRMRRLSAYADEAKTAIEGAIKRGEGALRIAGQLREALEDVVHLAVTPGSLDCPACGGGGLVQTCGPVEGVCLRCNGEKTIDAIRKRAETALAAPPPVPRG